MLKNLESNSCNLVTKKFDANKQNTTVINLQIFKTDRNVIKTNVGIMRNFFRKHTTIDIILPATPKIDIMISDIANFSFILKNKF